jgi:hypothetical protein
MAKTYRKNRLEVIKLCEELQAEQLQHTAEMVNEFWLPLFGVKSQRRFKFGLNPFKWWQTVPLQTESEAFYELFDHFYKPDEELADLLERAKASKAKTITLAEDEWLDLYATDEEWNDLFVASEKA